MQVSVDISLYPLHQDYIPQIDAFILLLNQEPAVQVSHQCTEHSAIRRIRNRHAPTLKGNGRSHGDS